MADPWPDMIKNLSDYRPPISLSKSLSPTEMHNMVKASGQPNYLHCRIPVPSQLKISAWKEVLQVYWDSHLIQLLEFGFPLDFKRNSQLSCNQKNHKSALEFQEHVDAYLEEELMFGNFMPFSTASSTHFSPFMTREKKWF